MKGVICSQFDAHLPFCSSQNTPKEYGRIRQSFSKKKKKRVRDFMQCWSWGIDIRECLSFLCLNSSKPSTTQHLSTWVHHLSRYRVLSMRLAFFCEERNFWIVSWHRNVPSQSLDEMLSEHKGEIVIHATGYIHWGKSSKLGNGVQCCTYISIHQSIAYIPEWFGPCYPPCSGVLRGRGSSQGTTAVSEESRNCLIQQSEVALKTGF